MAEHTPKPWRYRDENVQNGYRVFRFNEFAGSFCQWDGDGEVVWENAKLIAAAPDLLESSQKVMSLLEKHGSSIVPHLMDTDENAGEELRQAIARAKSGACEAEEKPIKRSASRDGPYEGSA